MNPLIVVALIVAMPFVFAAMLAWIFVISKRATRLWAMTNQVFTGTPTSRRQLTLPASANLLAGQPVLVGKEPYFLLDNYQSNVAGCTGFSNGSFTATVVGQTSESPVVTHQINPGDQIYANGGTLDATTNVTYGFTIDANSGGTPFGHLDPTSPPVLAGVTLTTAIVQL
jgi:hypothetical protein